MKTVQLAAVCLLITVFAVIAFMMQGGQRTATEQVITPTPNGVSSREVHAGFDELRAEAKTCPKGRLKDIYRQVADEIMAAVAELEPHEDKAQFP